MTSAKYFLRSQAFLCKDDPYWVVLDLAHDRYLCIEADRFARMTPLLAGWAINDDPPSPEIEQYCAELTHHGVLIRDSVGSKPVRPDSIVQATSSLRDLLHIESRARIRASARFASATAWAHWTLRHWPLSRIVGAVREQNARRPQSGRDLNLERAAELVNLFDLLRPYFPRPYLCLFDSLALWRLLAAYRLYPQWVFAARAEPFAAHCWLQIGHVVINDSMDRIVEYKPIMAA